LTGFITNLAYTIPEESTWETEQGKRAPKFIVVNISYKVIHDISPDLSTRFYGYKGIG